MRAIRFALTIAACLLLLVLGVVAHSHAQPQPAPLTEIETLRVEVISLRGQLLQQQLDAFHAERTRLTQTIEAARPGWAWDIATGKFTQKTEK